MKMLEIEGLHELDGDWGNLSRVIPYGFGIDAKRTLKRLVQDFDVPFIVDQDESKWGQRFMGVEVVSPNRLEEVDGARDRILVTIARRRYNEIKKTLESYGFRDHRDFCHLGQFAVEWYYRYRREHCLFTLDIALTTACTLRCKHCNMFIPHYSQPFMNTFDSVKRSMDLLMERIDYVFTIGLLGGEALLCPDLTRIVEYFNQAYRCRIGQVAVVTNGVVPPSDAMAERLKSLGVQVAISDYTDAIGERSKVDEVKHMMENAGIPVGVMRNRQWCDFGFPRKPWGVPKTQARRHMLQCNPGWRGLGEGRLYWCNVGWSAEKAGLFHLQQGDYVELKDLPAHEESSKRTILSFCAGNLPGGHMSFCRVCGGCGKDNPNMVKAGVQVGEEFS